MKARENPLRTERVLRARFRLNAVEDKLTWDKLLARLEAQNWRGALLGPEGSGKTTLLEDFVPYLTTRGWRIRWLRLSRETPRFAPEIWTYLESVAPDEIILFDGAEQLPRRDWKRFLVLSRPAAGLLITSHRAGLLPTLVECRTTPQLLRAILEEILGNDANLWSVVKDVEYDVLWARHQGNLRHALREIYDIYAAHDEPVAP